MCWRILTENSSRRNFIVIIFAKVMRFSSFQQSFSLIKLCLHFFNQPKLTSSKLSHQEPPRRSLLLMSAGNLLSIQSLPSTKVNSKRKVYSRLKNIDKWSSLSLQKSYGDWHKKTQKLTILQQQNEPKSLKRENRENKENHNNIKWKRIRSEWK